MSQAMTRANQVSSGYKKYLLALYYLATAKFTLSFAVFGLLLVGLGAAIAPFGANDPLDVPTPINSTAGILGVIGTSFFVFGILLYLVLLVNRKVGEALE